MKFSKMHSLGNDFLVIETLTQSIDFNPEKIQKWANRHTGIGFDQCLVIEKSLDDGIDFIYRIFNADGQEVGQCGNGARCLARFIQKHGLSTKKRLTVATLKTQLVLELNEDQTVTVNMGKPNFNPALIPYHANLKKSPPPFLFYPLSIGNPHAVIFVDHIEDIPLIEVGTAFNQSPEFPEGVNVEFVQIMDAKTLKIRVFERGCGETLACGSGACAAVIAGIKFHQLESKVEVKLPLGQLEVQWAHEDAPVLLCGPASFVFEGHWVD